MYGQVTRFLGIDVDSVAMELRLPEDKLKRLIEQLKLYLRKRKATRLELEIWVGGCLRTAERWCLRTAARWCMAGVPSLE